MQDRRTAFRVRRAALNFTQRQAADAADIELNRFVRIENEYADPTPAESKRIARALKAKPDELLLGQVSA